MEMNIFRFSAGKTLAEVQALNEVFRASKSYEEFKLRGEEIYKRGGRTIPYSPTTKADA